MGSSGQARESNIAAPLHLVIPMLEKLFGKKKKAANDEVAQLSPAISSSILSLVGARSIPPMPAAAQKAFQLSTDANAEARDFVEVIEADEALSARIVKIANSVFFERGKQTTTIEDAVLVIGIEELRCLLNATALSDLFPSSHSLRAQCWANDIATAAIARSLAQRLRPDKADLAFLGGLMHDIGKLLLIQRAPEMYAKVAKLVERDGKPFHEAETEVFVFNHNEVGQLIAERWSFSQELIDILRNHHRAVNDHDYVASTPLSLAMIVKSADIISHALGLGHPTGFSKLQKHCEAELPVIWDILRVSKSKQRDTLEQFKKSFEAEYEMYAGK